MVPSKKKEVLWIPDLVRQQQASALNGVLPTIHIVAKEEVVGFRRESPYLKQPQQIIVLSMNVSYKHRQMQTHTHTHSTYVPAHNPNLTRL